MKLLVFGSRTWDDPFIIGAVLQGFLAECQLVGETLTIIDGKARGADCIAGSFYGGAEDGMHGIHDDVLHERYAADWDLHGRSAGPMRNARMLAQGKPGMAVGFVEGLDGDGRPNTDGSRDTYDRLVKTGVPVYLVVRSKP